MSCVATRCCSSLYKQYFFMLQKRHFERRIISKHKDIQCSQRSPCRTTGPNHAGFSQLPRWQSLEHIKTRFGTYENMIVCYVVSDKSHVSRLDNPASLRLIVGTNMSNSEIKHPQSENDKAKPVGEIISFCKKKGASGYPFLKNLNFTQP